MLIIILNKATANLNFWSMDLRKMKQKDQNNFDKCAVFNWKIVFHETKLNILTKFYESLSFSINTFMLSRKQLMKLKKCILTLKPAKIAVVD